MLTVGRQVQACCKGISGLVAEYIVAIYVTRAQFPADACSQLPAGAGASPRHDVELLLRLPCPCGICGSDCATQDEITADRSAWDCCLAESMLRPRLRHIPQRPKRCTASGCRHAPPGGLDVDNSWPSSKMLQGHQWSSGRIHRCHRCDPGSIPG